MKVLHEEMAHTGGYLVSTANGYRHQEQGVVAQGAGIVKPGTVLGKVTATGKFVPLNPAATDGSEGAAGILFEGCDATETDIRRTVTVRDCEIHLAGLIWPDGITGEQKTTALDGLAAIGLIAR